MRPAPNLEAEGLDALVELLSDLWAEEAVVAARPLSPITEASQSPERAAERRIGPMAPDPELRGTP
jgi:hypothetical protein